jgi:hypothetical protein
MGLVWTFLHYGKWIEGSSGLVVFGRQSHSRFAMPLVGACAPGVLRVVCQEGGASVNRQSSATPKAFGVHERWVRWRSVSHRDLLAPRNEAPPYRSRRL